MYCANCGKQLHDEAVICPACGCATGRYVQPVQKIGNPLAIVGFVCAMVASIFFMFAWSGFAYRTILLFVMPHSIVGLICSIIGWIKGTRRQAGKGLAIAGFVVSCVWLVFAQIIVFTVIFA